MRREEIEELIRIVEESQITELEICEGKKKIRISKAASAALTPALHMPLPAAIPITGTDAANETTESPDLSKLASNLKYIIRNVQIEVLLIAQLSQRTTRLNHW